MSMLEGWIKTGWNGKRVGRTKRRGGWMCVCVCVRLLERNEFN